MLQTATPTPLSTSRKRVFDSLFSPISVVPRPDSISASQQSERAIPGYSGSSRPSRAKAKVLNEPEPERVTWQQSWHAATTFLAVADGGYNLLMAYEDSDCEDEEGGLKHWNHQPPSKDVLDALGHVVQLRKPLTGLVDSSRSDSHGLLEWYDKEIRRHFLKNFRTVLVQVSPFLELNFCHRRACRAGC